MRNLATNPLYSTFSGVFCILNIVYYILTETDGKDDYMHKMQILFMTIFPPFLFIFKAHRCSVFAYSVSFKILFISLLLRGSLQNKMDDS